jgi:solute carrier family 10 (sodium/bile acid cotransporter), member 7
LGFDRADESAMAFYGSQKSVVSGIPIANALIAGPGLGLFVLPMMIYHSMQLLVCAWLAKGMRGPVYLFLSSETAIR